MLWGWQWGATCKSFHHSKQEGIQCNLMKMIGELLLNRMSHWLLKSPDHQHFNSRTVQQLQKARKKYCSEDGVEKKNRTVVFHLHNLNSLRDYTWGSQPSIIKKSWEKVCSVVRNESTFHTNHLFQLRYRYKIGTKNKTSLCSEEHHFLYLQQKKRFQICINLIWIWS